MLGDAVVFVLGLQHQLVVVVTILRVPSVEISVSSRLRLTLPAHVVPMRHFVHTVLCSYMVINDGYV